MKRGRWSQRSDACTECNRSDRPHKAKELCGTCYSRLRDQARKKFHSCKHKRCVKCKKTDARHFGHGLCQRCYQKKDYRENPDLRKRRKAAAKRFSLRNADRVADRNREYQLRNRETYLTYKREHNRLISATGYSHTTLKGDLVTAMFLVRPCRILRRYVVDGECVADLDSGTQIYDEVPLSSLSLAEAV